MPVSALSAVIDNLIGEGPDTLCDGESMVAFRREMARWEALMTSATARFDTSREWEADGARTAAAWLAWQCHLPRTVTRRQVSLGRKLRHLPACAHAWLDGQITAHHVSVIGAVRRPATEDALARDEKLLVDNAEHLRFDAFNRTVNYWAQRADPDGAEDDDHDRRDQRQVFLAESFGGMWLGKITLDPISGTIVAGELGRLEKQLFDADWADAKARLGHDPTIFDLARTPAQRRADALVEMATRSAAMPPDARRPAPLFSVFVANPARTDLRTRRRDRAGPRGADPLARSGLHRTGRFRPRRPGRGIGAGPAVHRRHPKSRGTPRPVLRRQNL